MMIVIFAAAIAILLALSRRKMGVFMLAATAGLLLNDYWNGSLTEILSSAGLNIPEATLSGIIGLVLILTLAVMSLGKSQKESSWAIGIIGSVMATVFVVLLILPSFLQVFTLDGFSRDITAALTTWSSWIILIGVIAALVDFLSIKRN